MEISVRVAWAADFCAGATAGAAAMTAAMTAAAVPLPFARAEDRLIRDTMRVLC